MHKNIKLKVLYFGTPVILISTLNEDGSANLAPMSSGWWLDQTCVLGMSTKSKTVENLKREKQAVLNLPGPELVSNVNKLAMLTGKNPVPQNKFAMGYKYEPCKFEIASFTPIDSQTVKPPRVLECPVNLEVLVKNIQSIGQNDDNIVAIEVEVIEVHIDEDYLIPGTNYINTENWSPLIMNFCEFFGLSRKLHPSKLAAAFFPTIKKSDK